MSEAKPTAPNKPVTEYTKAELAEFTLIQAN